MKTDTQIQLDVRSELGWNSRISSADIGISVNDGLVTLYGDVPHFMEKIAAEQATERVSGFQAVVNEIEVRFLDDSSQRDDRDIAEAAVTALKWTYGVPSDIKISVSKGMITLKGEVDWAHQKSVAENAVQGLLGVCAVINELEIKATLPPSDLKPAIEAAFKRSAKNEGKGITVKVEGTRVILTGGVRCLADKNNASHLASRARGVSRVENNLKVAK